MRSTFVSLSLFAALLLCGCEHRKATASGETPRTALAASCATGSECESRVCNAATRECEQASCGDGIANGDELGIDCGGASCVACAASEATVSVRRCTAGDCHGGTCDAETGRCAPSTCSDRIWNGDETYIDCGGLDCPRC